MNVSKIVGAYVQWLRVEPAISLSFQYKLSSEHEISFGIKCAVHIHTSAFLLSMCLNKLSLFVSKFASAYTLYKTSIRHFSNTQFYHHN
jgi:Gpi18-like mannosyltransferase